MAKDYSFCESNCAAPRSPWHIRELTTKGRKLGGGIDTPSLCERVKAGGGWDLDVELNTFHLQTNTCHACLAIFLKQRRDEG
jgi:hypothetical protein